MVCLTFSHPDYTVGPGITPGLSHNLCMNYTPLRTRGLNKRIKYVERSSHRRSGIAPCPEGLYRQVCHKYTGKCKGKKVLREGIVNLFVKMKDTGEL